MGIVNGSEENGDFIFRPDGKITRCEFAVMAVNALGLNLNEYSNVDLKKFVDFNKIPDWAADYVKAACEYGIISGKSEVSGVYFAPNEYITRAEAATIISRMLPSKLAAKTVSYKDSTSIPDWALKPIKVLNTANLIKGYDDNTIKPQNNVTRAEAATMLYNIF